MEKERKKKKNKNEKEQKKKKEKKKRKKKKKKKLERRNPDFRVLQSPRGPGALPIFFTFNGERKTCFLGKNVCQLRS